MWLPKSEQQQVSRLSDWRTFLQWWEVIKEWEKDLQKWLEGSVLVTFVFAVTNTRQEATQRKKRFILANSLRECSQSRWSSHSSESNSRRRWWKLAHIWMGQEADRRLETKMDYKQKVLPQSDTFPLSRHCLPKTHTPPHFPKQHHSWRPSIQTRGPMETISHLRQGINSTHVLLGPGWGGPRAETRQFTGGAGHVNHLLLQTPQYPPEQCKNLYG